MRRHQDSPASGQEGGEGRLQTLRLCKKEQLLVTRGRKGKGIGHPAGGPRKLTQPKPALNLIRARDWSQAGTGLAAAQLPSPLQPRARKTGEQAGT